MNPSPHSVPDNALRGIAHEQSWVRRSGGGDVAEDWL
jgi:hypothetical protein